jgi:hypothetical protein
MTRPHHYVHCDVPEGMTLAEYRSAKLAVAAKRPRRGLVARLRRRSPERSAGPERRAA